MIKPEFFDDPVVAELTPLARLFFIGLWTRADREGRLEADPRRLKAWIFPYDTIDVVPLIQELEQHDMIRRYSDRRAVERHGQSRKNTVDLLWIRTFVKHQRPHPKEPQSLIPEWSQETAKKHGEPWQKTANPSESGVLILDSGVLNTESGTRNLERKAVPSARSLREQDKNLKIITKIAHEVLRKANGHRADVDAVEAIKILCAKRHIAYDSAIVRKALDSAEATS